VRLKAQRDAAPTERNLIAYPSVSARSSGAVENQAAGATVAHRHKIAWQASFRCTLIAYLYIEGSVPWSTL
jgi:hypothetical protein